MPRANQHNQEAQNTHFYLKLLKILFAVVMVAAATIAVSAYATASPFVFLGYIFNAILILATLNLLAHLLRNTEALVFRRVDNAFQDQEPRANIIAAPNHAQMANQLPFGHAQRVQAQAAGLAFFPQAPNQQQRQVEEQEMQAVHPI